MLNSIVLNSRCKHFHVSLESNPPPILSPRPCPKTDGKKKHAINNLCRSVKRSQTGKTRIEALQILQTGKQEHQLCLGTCGQLICSRTSLANCCASGPVVVRNTCSSPARPSAQSPSSCPDKQGWLQIWPWSWTGEGLEQHKKDIIQQMAGWCGFVMIK